jgi:hypothetical protein
MSQFKSPQNLVTQMPARSNEGGVRSQSAMSERMKGNDLTERIFAEKQTMAARFLPESSPSQGNSGQQKKIQAPSKEQEINPQVEIEKTDAEKLDEVWDKGNKIESFKALAKKADVTIENLHTVVVMGNSTVTNPFNGQITLIRTKTVDELIVDLAHEMTNRLRRSQHVKAIKEVKSGSKTPEQFADKILDIEMEGIKNQVKVASKLQDFDFRLKAMNDFLRRYKAGELSDKQLLAAIHEQIETAVNEDGESAKDAYIQDGENYRNAQLEREKRQKK